MYKYYKYAFITIMCCISAASFASSNIQKTANNFNFKNLSAQKHYAALDDYGAYDPAKAINACTTSPNSLPADGIWPTDPSNPIPSSPEPTGSDCEISSQMAYGCTNYASTTGRALTKSVVGIMVQDPKNYNLWHLICTGTIIDSQWVLTAAHCVIKDKSTSLINTRSLIAVPWQELEQLGTYGVPTILEQNMFGAYNIIKVRSVNIPKAYTGPVTNAYNPDLALLKIEAIKPYMGLEPISVANTSILNKPETPVISAGYGNKEDQEVDGQLHYRKSYYMTNMYNSSWRGGISNNYGNIYTLDSRPIDYNGKKSAWSFTGQGDSGGPVLSYNTLTHKFQVEGVQSAGLFCNYAGYFAKLPYPYSVAVSTTYPQNYNFIKSVINGTSNPSQVSCNGECYFKTLYVVNQTSNNISNYNFDHNNLLLGSETSTGNYPTQIAFSPVDNIAFVTNFVSNSISQYDINLEFGLINPRTINLPSSQSGPLDIAFLSADYMVVLAKNSNSPSDSQSYSLLKYGQGFANSWHFREAQQTLDNPTHLNVIWIDGSEHLLVTNDHEIAVYEWDMYNYNLVNTNDKLELSSDMGKLIEIKPFGESKNQKLYVLTTKGVYIYQLSRNYENITFTLIKNRLQTFSPDSHLVPLYENSFAISDNSSTVWIFQLDYNNNIMFTNTIVMPTPGQMAFDNGTLYIARLPRSLYSYTISYPDLTISTEYKTVRTGEKPTVIKINRQHF